MDTSRLLRSRFWTGAALVPVSVVALLACWSLSGPAGPSSSPPAGDVVANLERPGQGAAAGTVLLRVPDGLAAVTLDDTPVARAFAAMLPIRMTLHDPVMGPAKLGQLPEPIEVAGAERVVTPRVGELYYWAPSHMIAIFYDDLGQSIPRPGLVRLGEVESGLAALRTADNGLRVQIELAGYGATAMAS